MGELAARFALAESTVSFHLKKLEAAGLLAKRRNQYYQVFALAREMGARLEDLSGTIHVHPTMTETLPEAALAALGHAIHA